MVDTPAPLQPPTPPSWTPPPAPLRVAAVQDQPVPGDVVANAGAAGRWTRAAARNGAALVVLPELFLPAYHPPSLADPGVDVAADEERRVADPRLDPVRAAARATGTTVVLGAAVRHADGQRTCAILVVDRDGEVLAPYDKQHLWGAHEQALFVAGDDGASIWLAGWNLALGVCYDGCFPEHGRAAALAGGHGYLCPSGYVVGSEHRRDLYYRARALDNTMYVVFANSVGGDGQWSFNGGAAVYDPQGRVLSQGPDQAPTLVVAELEPAALVATRAAHRMLTDRRAELGGRREYRLDRPETV